jgi:hypothetical protein
MEVRPSISRRQRARQPARSRLVPLPALASEEISANALRVAATRGRLKASKAADGTWRSTRAWVEEYLAGRYERESLQAPSIRTPA